MDKNIGYLLVAAIIVTGVLGYAKDPVSVTVLNEDGRVQVIEKTVGGTIGSDILHDVSFRGKTAVVEWTIGVAANGSYTLSDFESGATIYATASGSTTTLPAVQAGLRFTFVVGGALDSRDWNIDSAEGDNIHGILSVNNADVVCAAVDQINFITDGETVGDFFELSSNGVGWFITGSDVSTAAKLTCTDPT